ncbi:MAG: hypothetical protein JOZ69_04030 [Myxococcales bacterium]|nr:hypothetical protein [Myxococcales bacterium]
MEIERTEFEATLSALQGLTRGQLAELVLRRVSPADAATLHVFRQGLSLEALRLVSARALVRTRPR